MDNRPTFAWSQNAIHMGQLKRAETQWDVYLEVAGDGVDKKLRRGRVHFVAGERHRESAWIFLEYSDRDVTDRFNDFSAMELWSLLESLGPPGSS
ncbi:MAG TPA: hypothetical protein VGI92_11840 [Gemmatimonadales bacterium]|jgi:hypothetical protein